MITEEEISNQNNNIFDLSHPNARLAQCLNSVLNVKAVVAAFNQEKALVGAFSVITNLRMELFEALIVTSSNPGAGVCAETTRSSVPGQPRWSWPPCIPS